MAKSSIEWTDLTWNPTTGCKKVSKECDNCYAERETNRYMHNPNLPKYSKGFNVFVQHEDTLSIPYEWKKPKVVFVNSMSDLFHKDITLDFLKKVFKVMNETPQHTYQILTKRHNILDKYSGYLKWTDNIWMGVSVGSEVGERRIKPLVECGAKHKFLSVEPLIEELPDLDLTGIDWVVVGGESGNGARQMEKEWVLKVKKNCDDQGVPFFFKQWGDKKYNPDQNDPTINKQHSYHSKGGCMLEGNLYLANPCIKDNKTPPLLKVFDKEYFVMEEYEGLNTIWELKSYLPLMDYEIYDQLKKDIRKNGLTDPILYTVTKGGKKLVIEGHTRLRACIETRKKGLPTKEVKDKFENIDEIKMWMVKHQIQRRNLSDVQRIELAIKNKPQLDKLAKENLSKAGKGKDVTEVRDTNQELAKLAGVSRTTITRYLSVLKNSSKTLLKDLHKENITISRAYALTEKGKKKKPTKIEPSKKDVELKTYDSIKDATAGLKSNHIDGIIIISSKEQIEKLTSYQKKKYGILYFDK